MAYLFNKQCNFGANFEKVPFPHSEVKICFSPKCTKIETLDNGMLAPEILQKYFRFYFMCTEAFLFHTGVGIKFILNTC